MRSYWCGLVKKKNVALDPFQTTPSEGRAMTFQ